LLARTLGGSKAVKPAKGMGIASRGVSDMRRRTRRNLGGESATDGATARRQCPAKSWDGSPGGEIPEGKPKGVSGVK